MTLRGGVRYFAFEARAPEPANGQELSAPVAHEIKNSLQSALDLLQLIRLELKTKQGMQFALLLEQELGAIENTVQSRLNRYRQDIQAEPTKLATLVADVLNGYRSRLAANRISVTTHADQSFTEGHPGQLRQLISNLVLNAVDAMPQGGRLNIRVRGAIERTGRRRRGVRLTIADTGCGIEEEKLLHLFDQSFTTKNAGSGLGLRQVKEIVANQQGSVRVRSATRGDGSGTVFSIFLPSVPPR